MGTLFPSATQVSKDLNNRYKMDPETWEKSKRKSFFYRFELIHIMAILVVMVAVFIIAPFRKVIVFD